MSSRARDPVDEPRPLGQLGLQRDVVEIEPARPRGLRAVRIDGDDLEVGALAEPQERVVRAHRDVLAAGLRRDAGDVGDVLDAVGERRRGDDQMVERRGGEDRERDEIAPAAAVRHDACRADQTPTFIAAPASSGGEIELDSSRRSDRGRTPATTPEPICWRHAYSTLARVERRERRREARRGERHVVDDAGLELARAAAADDVQDRLLAGVEPRAGKAERRAEGLRSSPSRSR